MKTYQFIFSILLLSSVKLIAQVGIGTTTPTAALDINGDLRIRMINTETNFELAKDSLLVLSRQGIVKNISSKAVYESTIKSSTKVKFASISEIDFELTNGTSLILPFNGEEMDNNEEYNTSTYTFSPKQAGVYQIYATVNLAPDDVLGATSSVDVGLQIKNGSDVIAEASSALVGATVGITNVYMQPIRSVMTMEALNVGDEITFHLINRGSAPIDVDLLTGDNAYIFVQQVR